MKKNVFKNLILLGGIVVLVFSSCKKNKEEELPGFMFEIQSGSNLVLDLSWTVDGFSGSSGYSIVDLDLIFDDTSAAGVTASSTYFYNYETINLLSSTADKDYFIGFKYVANNTSMSGTPTSRYTFTATPAGSSSSQTYSGTYSQSASSSKTKFFLKVVKSGTSYKFYEVNFNKNL